MGHNGSGVYSLPDGVTATTLTKTNSADFNRFLADIAAAQNYARVISNGGTGATTASGAVTNLGFTESAPDISGCVGFTVPTGGIIMWSGAISAIPAGWALCDGANGTPNLTGRFVVHADADSGGTYDVGDTGGSDDVTLTEGDLPSHTHGAGTLAANSAGEHAHPGGLSTSAGAISAGASIGFASTTGFAGAHTHTISGSTAAAGSGDAHENRPPYYALAYIMKT